MSYQQQLLPLDGYNLALQANVHPIEWVNPTPKGRYNLVVIGAGTAGLVTAAGAAGLGAKVALIERGLMGGDCLNVGCVPSKAIIAAARRVAEIKQASEMGVNVDSPQVDFSQIMQRLRRLRAEISPHDSAQRFSDLGIDVYFGQGTFVDSDTIEVTGQKLRFKKAVIATGARAAELPIPGLAEAGFLNNENLFSLTELPDRMVVIGGGPIGCEMAQAFARFGTEVTLVEQASHILIREETDAAKIVQESLIADGVKLLSLAKVIKVSSDDKQKIVHVEQAGQSWEVACDEILVSIGRTPNLDRLGLDAVAVKTDPRQGVVVNDRLQTSNRKIYAAGDVCSRFKFTHAADFMARIVIQNALFMGRSKFSSLIIPWCTYTSPEIAHVGLYPVDAAEQGIKTTSFTQTFAQIDRMILDSDREGFVRIHCLKGSDKIIGATVVGTRAGDLIGEIVMAMKHRIGLSKIASVIHPYPTQAEAIRKLGDQYNRTRLTPFVKGLFQRWLAWSR